MKVLTVTVNFSTSPTQKALLELWAKQDERSISYILRKLVEAERVRRTEQVTPKERA